MEQHFSYKTITTGQLGTLLWALQTKELDLRTFRVFMACQEMVAIREAAHRVRSKEGQPSSRPVRYTVSQVEKLTTLATPAVKKALRCLKELGLLSFGEQEIRFGNGCLAGSEALVEELAGGRSVRRPVPVPRTVLRFLAHNDTGGLSKIIAAYLTRGMSIRRRTGEITCAGTVKASWMAEVCGMSRRSVKYAQADLQRRGWITKDTQSFQRKLNRHGAYFQIDPTLSFEGARKVAIVKPSKPSASIAPPAVPHATRFAPPNKDKETSIESKDRETSCDEASGVCRGHGKAQRRSSPDLRRIRREDLLHFDRAEELYFQAVERCWIPNSEAMALNFLSAVVRAREVGKDPPRLLVAVVRKGLWHHITQAQEERARQALVRFREQDPGRFRWGGEGGRTATPTEGAG